MTTGPSPKIYEGRDILPIREETDVEALAPWLQPRTSSSSVSTVVHPRRAATTGSDPAPTLQPASARHHRRGLGRPRPHRGTERDQKDQACQLGKARKQIMPPAEARMPTHRTAPAQSPTHPHPTHR